MGRNLKHDIFYSKFSKPQLIEMIKQLVETIRIITIPEEDCESIIPQNQTDEIYLNDVCGQWENEMGDHCISIAKQGIGYVIHFDLNDGDSQSAKIFTHEDLHYCVMEDQLTELYIYKDQLVVCPNIKYSRKN